MGESDAVVLNIEGLPVYRDSFGGIGTPTSDHEGVRNGYQYYPLFFAIVNGYNGKEGLKEAAGMIQSLLRETMPGIGRGEPLFFE